jgi:hypothetical protein
LSVKLRSDVRVCRPANLVAGIGRGTSRDLAIERVVCRSWEEALQSLKEGAGLRLKASVAPVALMIMET